MKLVRLLLLFAVSIVAGVSTSAVTSAQTFTPPQTTTGQELSDGDYTFTEDAPATGSPDVNVKTSTDDAGNTWKVLTVTIDGTIRQYFWDAETQMYAWGANPVKTIKIVPCDVPGCNGKSYERSDGPDGDVYRD